MKKNYENPEMKISFLPLNDDIVTVSDHGNTSGAGEIDDP